MKNLLLISLFATCSMHGMETRLTPLHKTFVKQFIIHTRQHNVIPHDNLAEDLECMLDSQLFLRDIMSKPSIQSIPHSKLLSIVDRVMQDFPQAQIRELFPKRHNG